MAQKYAKVDPSTVEAVFIPDWHPSWGDPLKNMDTWVVDYVKETGKNGIPVPFGCWVLRDLKGDIWTMRDSHFRRFYNKVIG